MTPPAEGSNLQPTQSYQVRGQRFEIVKMEGPELLGWGRLGIANAQTQLEGLQLARSGDEKKLRKALKRMLGPSVDLVVRSLRCPEPFAKTLTPGEQRQIIERQDQINQTGQAASDDVAPATEMVELYSDGRGLCAELVAHAADDLVLWLELQVLSAREQVRIQQLQSAGRLEDVKRSARALALATLRLVVMALGCDAKIAAGLSEKERALVIGRQDVLNNVEALAPLVSNYAYQAYFV